MVSRLGIPLETIPAAGLHGVGFRALPGNISKLALGYSRSRKIVEEFDPDVMFFTGGYLGIPVALAGLGRRKVLYVPDIEPALALKALAYVADQIAITVTDSKSYFPASWKNRLILTGYPVRQEFMSISREQARNTLGLDQDMPVLLVSGGSRGARSINRALLASLPGLLTGVQVLHITGQLDWQECQDMVENAKVETNGQIPWERYHALPYLHEMGLALASADLVLSRAGASTLGEYPFFGLPAILVPYPYAWKYQQLNAEWLEKRGAAVVLPDEEIHERLLPTVQNLIVDDLRLAAMQRNSKELSRPGAADEIARILMQDNPSLKRRETC